jgi:hypothetical protein
VDKSSKKSSFPCGHLAKNKLERLLTDPQTEQEDLTARQLRILARLVREEFG